ncbi:MAG TPA: imidazole glycerol phosphate synthase subunit HisH [Actinomycetota bacterium]
MRAPTIAVLDYGMGNLHSVSRAVARVGGDAVVTGDASAVAGAAALVIPGVGHFGACMRALADGGADAVIRDFAASGKPVFGVCVGMQVLFEGSDEDPDPGLGLLPGRSRRLTGDVKVPHMGWNTVEWIGAHPYIGQIASGTRFYFVHSYAPEVDTCTVGSTEHGRPFAAVVARDNLFATQFHPEKSARAGLAIYAAFVKGVTSS